MEALEPQVDDLIVLDSQIDVNSLLFKESNEMINLRRVKQSVLAQEQLFYSKLIDQYLDYEESRARATLKK